MLPAVKKPEGGVLCSHHARHRGPRTRSGVTSAK